MTDQQLAAEIDDQRRRLNDLLREAWMQDLFVDVQLRIYKREGLREIRAVTYSKVLAEDATSIRSRVARAIG